MKSCGACGLPHGAWYALPQSPRDRKEGRRTAKNRSRGVIHTRNFRYRGEEKMCSDAIDICDHYAIRIATQIRRVNGVVVPNYGQRTVRSSK